MTKQEKPFKLNESEARQNISAMLETGRLEGIMTLVGQETINVEANGSSYPLPAGDYLIVRMSARAAGYAKVGWVPAGEGKTESRVEHELT